MSYHYLADLTLTGVKSATLDFYFGSPQIIPFNKLSGFELEEEVDVEFSE